MASLIETRRQETSDRFTALRGKIAGAGTRTAGKACVYATGSFARGEATAHSDLDLFIVGGLKDGIRTFSRLDEICVKADLIEMTRQAAIPDFSGDGQYLVHCTVHDLISTLGKPEDDSRNTFTARLLLLLESKPPHPRSIQQRRARWWKIKRYSMREVQHCGRARPVRGLTGRWPYQTRNYPKSNVRILTDTSDTRPSAGLFRHGFATASQIDRPGRWHQSA